jgi:L-2-hydroxyglutarate oxidase LhgO
METLELDAVVIGGGELLYEYCKRASVPHRRVGKLVVAVHEAELPQLDSIAQQARESGVDDLQWLDAHQISELEPAATAVRALLSPSTGIVDSHALLSALRRDAEGWGARVIVASPVLAGRVVRSGIELEIGGDEPSVARCLTVVNAAGLWAQSVARSITGVPAGSIPSQYFAKGHYFVLGGPSPFSHLVYPVPEPGGLGRAAGFYDAIRRYFPALADGALSAGFTGIRPKLSAPGSPPDDFVLQGTDEHGVPGLLNLYGIESPGMTASLALAELALEKLGT